jgi:N-methylhydantoinase A
MSEGYRVGVDVGGTFTDFTVIDGTGAQLLWKEDSTPDDPVRGIQTGLTAIAGQLDLELDELLSRTRLLVHGTTIATNLVIQRAGPMIGLLCTAGFRDVLYFRDGYKPERFNIHLRHPEPLVPRWLRLPVSERMTARGEARIPLDEDGVRAAAKTFRDAGVKAVAVALLWAVSNDAHERRAAEILREELPGVHVLCSVDILPEIREWARTSAAALSAYILPSIDAYLRRLEHTLADGKLGRPPLIMQINGGCSSVDEILARPVSVLASGPAAAPAAARFHAARVGAEDVITIDMGGTSLDVCLLRAGRPAVSRDLRVEDDPVGIPGIEVHSIGAGGGSIAWIDAGGALRVGPRSAGAVPGPACYGQGGEEPTVTDANVVLGYLAPAAFLGGRRTLRSDLSEAALERVAARLGLEPVAAAAGILRVVDSNMVAAIRAVSLQRGLDPRRFALVAGGGAGGLHAVRLARALGVERVLVPREAGTLCAFGMTVTDVRNDVAGALHQLTDSFDEAAVRSLLESLELESRGRLARDGFTPDEITIERFVDARYPGQVHELTVELGSGARLAEIVSTAFHAEHLARFTYAREDLPVEALHWRVSAYGRIERPAPPSAPATTTRAEPTVRRAFFSGSGWLAIDIWRAEELEAGTVVRGPAIVEAATTTILLEPGDVLESSAFGLFEITVGRAT